MRTTAREASNLYEIELLQQALHDYEQRENWRIMKRWVEQCYAPGTVATIEVQSHEEWDKTERYTRISTIVAYDAEGNSVPYDLSKPFFQNPAVSAYTEGTLSLLEAGEVPDQEQLYEDIYCAGCLCQDWVCTCSLPTEARTYAIAGGEPPFPWQITIVRNDGRCGQDLHPF